VAKFEIDWVWWRITLDHRNNDIDETPFWNILSNPSVPDVCLDERGSGLGMLWFNSI